MSGTNTDPYMDSIILSGFLFFRRKPLFQVFGLKRPGNDVLFTKPFAQVHELAALRAERTIGSLKPEPNFAAGGASVFARLLHAKITQLV
jgi:hypothetical protein